MEHLDLAGYFTTTPSHWSLPSFEQQDAIYLSSSRQMLEPILEETSEDEEHSQNSWKQYEHTDSFWSSAESDTGSVIKVDLNKDPDCISERDFACPPKRARHSEDFSQPNSLDDTVILRKHHKPYQDIESTNSLERFLALEAATRDSYGSQARNSTGSKRFDDLYSDADSYHSLSRSSSLVQFESLERQLLLQEQHASMSSLGNSSPSLLSFDGMNQTTSANSIEEIRSGCNSGSNSRRGSQNSLMKRFESSDARLHQTYYELNKLEFDDEQIQSNGLFGKKGSKTNVAEAGTSNGNLIEPKSDSESSMTSRDSCGSSGSSDSCSDSSSANSILRVQKILPDSLNVKNERIQSSFHRGVKNSAENLSEDSGYCEPSILNRVKSKSIPKNFDKFCEEDELYQNLDENEQVENELDNAFILMDNEKSVDDDDDDDEDGDVDDDSKNRLDVESNFVNDYKELKDNGINKHSINNFKCLETMKILPNRNETTFIVAYDEENENKIYKFKENNADDLPLSTKKVSISKDFPILTKQIGDGIKMKIENENLKENRNGNENGNGDGDGNEMEMKKPINRHFKRDQEEQFSDETILSEGTNNTFNIYKENCCIRSSHSPSPDSSIASNSSCCSGNSTNSTRSSTTTAETCASAGSFIWQQPYQNQKQQFQEFQEHLNSFYIEQRNSLPDIREVFTTKLDIPSNRNLSNFKSTNTNIIATTTNNSQNNNNHNKSDVLEGFNRFKNQHQQSYSNDFNINSIVDNHKDSNQNHSHTHHHHPHHHYHQNLHYQQQQHNDQHQTENPNPNLNRNQNQISILHQDQEQEQNINFQNIIFDKIVKNWSNLENSFTTSSLPCELNKLGKRNRVGSSTNTKKSKKHSSSSSSSSKPISYLYSQSCSEDSDGDSDINLNDIPENDIKIQRSCSWSGRENSLINPCKENLKNLENLQNFDNLNNKNKEEENSLAYNYMNASYHNLTLLDYNNIDNTYNTNNLKGNCKRSGKMSSNRRSSKDYDEIICKGNFLLDELSEIYDRNASILNDKLMEHSNNHNNNNNNIINNDDNVKDKSELIETVVVEQLIHAPTKESLASTIPKPPPRQRKHSNSSFSELESSEGEIQHIQLTIRKPPTRHKRKNEKTNSLHEETDSAVHLNTFGHHNDLNTFGKTFDQDPTNLKTSYAQSLEKCNFDPKELSNTDLAKIRDLPKRRFHSQASSAKKKNLVSSTPNLYSFDPHSDLEDDIFVSSAHTSMHQLPQGVNQKPLGILLPAGSRSSFGKEVSFCPIVSKYSWQEQSSEEFNDNNPNNTSNPNHGHNDHQYDHDHDNIHNIEQKQKLRPKLKPMHDSNDICNDSILVVKSDESSDDELLDNADATVIYNTKENELIAERYNKELEEIQMQTTANLQNKIQFKSPTKLQNQAIIFNENNEYHQTQNQQQYAGEIENDLKEEKENENENDEKEGAEAEGEGERVKRSFANVNEKIVKYQQNSTTREQANELREACKKLIKREQRDFYINRKEYENECHPIKHMIALEENERENDTTTIAIPITNAINVLPLTTTPTTTADSTIKRVLNTEEHSQSYNIFDNSIGNGDGGVNANSSNNNNNNKTDIGNATTTVSQQTTAVAVTTNSNITPPNLIESASDNNTDQITINNSNTINNNNTSLSNGNDIKEKNPRPFSLQLPILSEPPINRAHHILYASQQMLDHFQRQEQADLVAPSQSNTIFNNKNKTKQVSQSVQNLNKNHFIKFSFNNHNNSNNNNNSGGNQISDNQNKMPKKNSLQQDLNNINSSSSNTNLKPLNNNNEFMKSKFKADEKHPNSKGFFTRFANGFRFSLRKNKKKQLQQQQQQQQQQQAYLQQQVDEPVNLKEKGLKRAGGGDKVSKNLNGYQHQQPEPEQHLQEISLKNQRKGHSKDEPFIYIPLKGPLPADYKQHNSFTASTSTSSSAAAAAISGVSSGVVGDNLSQSENIINQTNANDNSFNSEASTASAKSAKNHFNSNTSNTIQTIDNNNVVKKVTGKPPIPKQPPRATTLQQSSSSSSSYNNNTNNTHNNNNHNHHNGFHSYIQSASTLSAPAQQNPSASTTLTTTANLTSALLDAERSFYYEDFKNQLNSGMHANGYNLTAEHDGSDNIFAKINSAPIASPTSCSPSRGSVSQKTQMFNQLGGGNNGRIIKPSTVNSIKIGLIETNLDTHETIITGKTRSLMDITGPQHKRFAIDKRLHIAAGTDNIDNTHLDNLNDGNCIHDDDDDDNDIHGHGDVIVKTTNSGNQIASVRRPHKSMEFLLDKENQKNILPPENELQKSHEQNPAALSEHQLRVQASLQRLNIPDWFRQYNQSTQRSPEGANNTSGTTTTITTTTTNLYKPGNFARKRTNDSGRWAGLNSKTTSLSSLGSQRSDRSPLLLSPSAHSHHGGQSGGANAVHTTTAQYGHGTAGAFSRWSTSHLNSTQTSPSVSQRGSFTRGGPVNSSFISVASGNSGNSVIRSSFRQPYLGWRSTEKLSQRTPHERLASSLIAQQQQQRTSPTQRLTTSTTNGITKLQPAVTPEIQSSIKEVTSAIVHYVNDQTNQQRSRSTSPNSR